jgi:hypothetical protein
MGRQCTARGLVAAAVAMLGLCAVSTPARAADAIEGSWLFENGQVLVEATGSGTFKGTVVKPTRFTACTHPVGQVMWQMSAAGGAYSGTHVWYETDCSLAPGGLSTWAITSTNPASYRMRFCTVAPGGGPPTFDSAGTPTGATRCTDLERLLPPQPAPTFATAVSLPATRSCRRPSRVRIRWHQPKADPLVRATVGVSGRRVLVLGATHLLRSIEIRGLPRRRFTMKVAVTTASGRIVKSRRSYRACG